MRGKEFIEYDNPYDVGMTGLLGFSSGYHAMMDCDVLLMLGTDFPYQQFYPTDAKIIQVDLRGEQIGRRTPVDLGLVGDVQGDTAGAAAAARRKGGSRHLDAVPRALRADSARSSTSWRRESRDASRFTRSTSPG